MKKRLIKGFSVYQEDIERLNWITSKTGMTNSEVVRYLVKKCAEDPVEQQIIMQDFIDSEGKKTGKERLLRIMSGKKRIKKSCATQRTQDPAVSSNCLSNSNQESTNNQPTAEEIQIIKSPNAKWWRD